jgi:hypothetical protein
MLRIAHCLDNRLIDGGKVVSPTHQPHFTPQKHDYFNVSGTDKVNKSSDSLCLIILVHHLTNSLHVSIICDKTAYCGTEYLANVV